MSKSLDLGPGILFSAHPLRKRNDILLCMRLVFLTFISMFPLLSLAQLSEDEIINNYEMAYQLQRNALGPIDSCGYSIRVPDKLKNKVALTFDDGPNALTTPWILDVLKFHHIHATFFVKGNLINGNEDILNRMLAEGHLIGNHSYSHPNFHVTPLPQIKEEITQTRDLLKPFALQQNYFRFPYGNSTCPSINFVKSQSYRIVGWDIDTCDWDFVDGTAATCVDNNLFKERFLDWIYYETKRVGGGVMLFHDIHENTARMLDQILTDLQQQNYQFVMLNGQDFPLLNERQ